MNRRSLSPFYLDGAGGAVFSRPSSYSECTSMDSVFERIQAYNRQLRDMMMNSLNDLDENTIINQGTQDYRHPQLAFHTIHGSNVLLQRGNRVAKRNESFCKGLAFSNRPIAIDEIVCIKLCEVSTNWSGVLRFGVTNVDPETYRHTTVPKFACPDLTSKEGYWAKALPERYSVEGHILHFHVTTDGDLHYGINGTSKGLFLAGINVDLPMWVIIDIYGNSQAVEFIDASEHRPRRHRHSSTTPVPGGPTAASSSTPLPRPPPPSTIPALPAHESHSNGDLSATNGQSNIAFHRVVGRHITLSSSRSVATRSEQEYSHGYVFTERPIANNEKITIQVTRVLDLYHGGLAVGLTCRDPATLRGMELPADSSDLVNFPEMFVGIKDVANMPPVNTRISFWVTDKAELKMQFNDREPRTLIFVDNSLQLFFYFDVYGSTQAIKLLGVQSIAPRSRSPAVREPSTSRMERAELPSSSTSSSLLSAASAIRERSATRDVDSSSLRVRDRWEDPRPPPVPTRRNNSVIEDLLTGTPMVTTPSSLPPPLAPLYTRPAPNPPPITPRPSSSSLTGSISSALTPTSIMMEQFSLRTPPVAPPISTIPSVPRRPPAPLPDQMRAPSIPPPSMPAPPRPAPLSSAGHSGSPVGEDEECTVCMSAQINSVIYTCGHMCMCYECAVQTKDLGHGCPICRQPMQDVIRTYKG